MVWSIFEYNLAGSYTDKIDFNGDNASLMVLILMEA